MELAELEKRIGITLSGWQRDFVLAREPRQILVCGRKTGKTEAMAVKIALMTLNEDFGKSHGILILSKGARQGKELFLKVRSYLAMCGIEFDRYPEEGKASASMSQIRMPPEFHENKIYSLPSGFTGDTLRTYSFYAIFRDEDSYIPEEVDVALDACLAVYGVMEVRAGTPSGNRGSFARAWFSGEYRRWHVTSEEEPRVSRDWIRKAKSHYTKHQYAEEVMAEFMPEEGAIFDKQLIRQCSAELDYAMLREKAKAVFFGVDFARFGEDMNSIAVGYLLDGRLYVTAEEYTSQRRMTEICGKIIAMFRNEKRAKVVVTDETGQGGGATDMLVEELGSRKVIGIQNQRREGEGAERKYAKTILYTNLLAMMERGKIVLDANVACIERSLRSMRPKYTRMGRLLVTGRNSHVAEAIVRCAFPMMERRAFGNPWIALFGSKADNS